MVGSSRWTGGNMTSVRDVILEAIERSGKTAYRALEDAGVNQSYGSRALNAKKPISPGLAADLARVLGLDADALLSQLTREKLEERDRRKAERWGSAWEIAMDPESQPLGLTPPDVAGIDPSQIPPGLAAAQAVLLGGDAPGPHARGKAPVAAGEATRPLTIRLPPTLEGRLKSRAEDTGEAMGALLRRYAEEGLDRES